MIYKIMRKHLPRDSVDTKKKKKKKKKKEIAKSSCNDNYDWLIIKETQKVSEL